MKVSDLALASTFFRRLVAIGLALSAITLGHNSASAEPATTVFLNGLPAPVFFNDGDSFRVLSGKFRGTKARLSGYNTLESYGPVHQWGDWTEKEMLVLAKMATLEARRGTWKCTSDLSTDTYGRMLVWCPGLAERLIELGYAHAMTVTREAARPELLAAQKRALDAKRGIWAHGIPDYVLTSLHSIEEDTEGKGTYNRLVSTADGHSLKWRHERKIAECEKLCDPGVDTPERIEAAVAALKGEAAVAEFIEDYDDDALSWIVRKTAQREDYAKNLQKAQHGAVFAAILEGYVASGRLGYTLKGPPACVTHVDFRRRFGGGRAKCLK